jgi:hypothetical protein
MNLIEAIKSGKKYRRKDKYCGLWLTPPDVITDLDPVYEVLLSDILAEDWEVEQTPVTITRDDFDAAWRRALDVSENMEITTPYYLYELVVRELGL